MKSRFLSAEDAALGEKDQAARKMLVDRCVKSFPKYSKRPIRLARKMLAEAPCFEGRRNSEEAYTDMLFHWFAYGFAPDEYVFFGLEKKTLEERMSYVSDRQRVMFVFQMNDFAGMDLFNDKFETYKRFKDYYKRDATVIEKADDFSEFLQFTKKHPVFVKKLVGQFCGRSVEKIDIANYDLKTLFNSLIAEGRTILEEVIVQSSEMAEYNASSINTIRVNTFYTRSGITIPFAFLKNGHVGSFVDNGGAGGILIGLNPENGEITTDGMDELGNVFTQHPESGKKYIGSKLPDWDQALSICKELAAQLPEFKYGSWDLAHTDKGWVVVEGNFAGQMVAQQMTADRGLKKEILSIMSNMELMA